MAYLMCNRLWEELLKKVCVIAGDVTVTHIFFSVSFFTSIQDGVSPVYVASKHGHTEVVDLLVQAGADIHLATTAKVRVSTHTVSSSVAAVVETNVKLFNPQHACSARVKAIVLFVCMSLSSIFSASTCSKGTK